MSKNPILYAGALASAIAGAACTDIPEACGRNVEKVTRLDFRGPTNLQGASGGYAVEVEVEKANPAQSAEVCYAVRDEDPVWKLFWAVDDVLTAHSILVPAGSSSLVEEGNFGLRPIDGEVCGSTPVELGCSGESEAEVYLQPVGAEGADSPTRAVRTQ